MSASKLANGFSMLELMVAFFIVSLLTLLIFVSLGESRQRSRDARRLDDIREIRGALEDYNFDQGSYPASLPLGQDLVGANGDIYYKSLPHDPQPNQDCAVSDYTYRQTDNGASYSLQFCLEIDSKTMSAGNYTAVPNELIYDSALTAGGSVASDDGKLAIFWQSAGLADIPTSSVYASWDSSIKLDDIYTLAANDYQVALSTAGHYLAMYSLPTETIGGLNRSMLNSWLELDDQVLDYGTGQSYIRRSGGTDEAYNSGAAIVEVTSGQKLAVGIKRTDTNTATVKQRLGQSGLVLLKLSDSWDYLRLKPAADQALGADTNFTDLTLATEDEIDSGSFGHSGATVTLKATGHYLVTYNVYLYQGTGTRLND